jgi:hypothetical protein
MPQLQQIAQEVFVGRSALAPRASLIGPSSKNSNPAGSRRTFRRRTCESGGSGAWRILCGVARPQFSYPRFRRQSDAADERRGKLQRDRQMKLGGRCPNCDYSFGAALVQSELHRARSHPLPGDMVVFVGCGLWLVLETDSRDESSLIVRDITTEELLTLPARSLDLMRKATRAIELIRTSQCF